MLRWLKKHWAIVAGIVAAIVAALGRRFALGRVDGQIRKQRERVNELQYEGARVDERIEQRCKAALEDEKIAEEATKRLEELKRRISRTLIPFVVVLVVAGLCFGGFVVAETPLAQKYEEALALIAELTAQRDEAVKQAETFQRLYEREKARREAADADLLAAREREKELYKIVQVQWDTIAKLSRGSGFGVTVGMVWNPSKPLEPMVQVGVLMTR